MKNTPSNTFRNTFIVFVCMILSSNIPLLGLNERVSYFISSLLFLVILVIGFVTINSVVKNTKLAILIFIGVCAFILLLSFSVIYLVNKHKGYLP